MQRLDNNPSHQCGLNREFFARVSSCYWQEGGVACRTDSVTGHTAHAGNRSSVQAFDAVLSYQTSSCSVVHCKTGWTTPGSRPYELRFLSSRSTISKLTLLSYVNITLLLFLTTRTLKRCRPVFSRPPGTWQTERNRPIGSGRSDALSRPLPVVKAMISCSV